MAKTATTAPEAASPRLLRCSFCSKSQLEVKCLIAGPAVTICDECVGLCQTIVANTPQTEQPAPFNPNWVSALPTERMLTILHSQEATYEDVSVRLKETVDVLRARKVSWEAIGKALGVSRQAAWERFS